MRRLTSGKSAAGVHGDLVFDGIAVEALRVVECDERGGDAAALIFGSYINHTPTHEQ